MAPARLLCPVNKSVLQPVHMGAIKPARSRYKHYARVPELLALCVTLNAISHISGCLPYIDRRTFVLGLFVVARENVHAGLAELGPLLNFGPL